MIRRFIQAKIEESLRELTGFPQSKSKVPGTHDAAILRRTRKTQNADFTSNIALTLSGEQDGSASDLADSLSIKLNAVLADTVMVSSSQTGHLNFRVKSGALQSLLSEIHRSKGNFGRSCVGEKQSISLERHKPKTNKAQINLREKRTELVSNCLSRLIKFCSYELDERAICSDETNLDVQDRGSHKTDLFISVWQQNDDRLLSQWTSGLKDSGVSPDRIYSVLIQNVRVEEEAGAAAESNELSFYLLSEKPQKPLLIDLKKIKTCSLKNPAFLISSTYQRLAATERVFRTANRQYADSEEPGKKRWKSICENWSTDKNSFAALFSDPDNLAQDAYRTLILRLDEFPDRVEASLKTRAPDQLCDYAQSLSQDCLQVLNSIAFLSEDLELQSSRTGLMLAARQCLQNAFFLLGLDLSEYG